MEGLKKIDETMERVVVGGGIAGGRTITTVDLPLIVEIKRNTQNGSAQLAALQEPIYKMTYNGRLMRQIGTT